MELLTAAQMRAVEEAATESGEVTGLQLMERAGRGAVEAIFDWRPDLSLTVGRALVLCGPGNNGGDGYVVARLLSERGWTVDARQYGPPAQRGDAAANRARWAAIDAVNDWDDRRLAEMVASRSHDLVIDALFGTGLARGLGDDVSELRRAMAEAAPDDGPGRFVAIDLPSGICSDSGANLGRALPADLAVSFHAYKLGHFLRPDGGEGGAGRPSALRLVEIGLDHAPEPTFARLAASPDPRDLAKAASGHKYSHGHALVLAGGVGEGGAARLAARAALRAGAGLVTLGAPPAAIIENAARLDAVMLARIGDAAALEEALADERINALALGPGLGVGARTRALVEAAVTTGRRAVVLDADALTSFQDEPEALFARLRGKPAVLTPHMGEFGRLFPDLRARLEEPPARGPAYSKVDAARDAAARAGCAVLMKGPDTVVAAETGAASVVSAQYERACPWLATAGAGDVLTGMIAGLLARGFDPKRAAETGAWLHQEAALSFGPGLIAEDLPEELPKVFGKVLPA